LASFDQCYGYLVEPKAEPKASEAENPPKANVSEIGRFAFESFDIGVVLKNASALLASGGQEYIGGLDSMDPKTLAKQRAQLKENLGFANTIGATTDDLLEDSDLMDTEPSLPAQPKQEKFVSIGSDCLASNAGYLLE